MKIGFTGTRKGLTEVQKYKLNLLLTIFDGSEINHGDCIGADATCHNLAIALGYKVISHPPIDSSLRAFCPADLVMKPLDYIKRNHEIVDSCDVLIACPGEKEEQLRSGTWSTIRYALMRCKPAQCIYPDGEVVIKI